MLFGIFCLGQKGTFENRLVEGFFSIELSFFRKNGMFRKIESLLKDTERKGNFLQIIGEIIEWNNVTI